MSRDSEFFIPASNVLETQKIAARKTNRDKKIHRCAGCDALIGAVSTVLYEIEEKSYCSGCYSRKIIFMANERDHPDIMQAKVLLKK